jgi:sporulation protein YlmC with PRC-barrel domain
MQTSKVWLATALLNRHVRNNAGDSFGEVEDLVIDPITGNVQYAIISVERLPGTRDHWPNFADPVWRRNVDDYYRTRPIERPRAVYMSERRSERRTGISMLGIILLIFVIAGVAWVTFLASTRGWEQTKQDVKTSIQGAAYAAKEGTLDAALTTRVKTALSLSKRIPAGKINVDSEGDIVTLRGEVPSPQIRDLAESVARDVPGVREVRNHLFAVSGSQ